MTFPLLSRCAAVALLASSACAAQAAEFVFAGHVAFDTDVVQIAFTLTAAAPVRLWTDSWQGGLNYDPSSVLWQQSGADYTRIDGNDDDSSIAPGQGSFDTGLGYTSLAAGNYLYTVIAYPNDTNGTLLSQGFSLDGSTPIPIAQWDQPGYDINADDQKGTLWRVHVDGADAASVLAAPVPEPTSAGLLGVGLALLAWGVKRQKKRG